MTFALVCAFIGLLVDGPPGLLIGGAVGYLVSLALQIFLRRGLDLVQRQFIETTFSVMGALCKADGVVTQDEIKLAERSFDQMRLSAEQRTVARAAFNRGKAPEFDLNAELDRFVPVARGRGFMLQLFLQLQVAAVAADGQVHPAERELLVQVARRVGLSELDVLRLEALLRAASGGAPSTGRPPPTARLDDAYAALGVTRETSPTEIKRAYRKLISENHPDKLAAKGFPESMRQLAEERSRKINAAYELLKRERGFS